MKKVSLLSLLGLALLPAVAMAQEAPIAEAAAAGGSIGLGLAFLGAALATGLACMGSSMGVSITGQAGAGLLTERPDLAGRVITFMVLPGSQGLYGMVISLLFLFNYAPVISGEIALSTNQGLVLLAAGLPVGLSCLWSSPYQAKVCAAGMHMIAKDEKLTGRVIIMAALVETYALLGFLVSFFIYNNYGAVLMG